MNDSGFEKVRGTECLYRYKANGKYYARFVANGKEIRRSLRTTDRELAKRELVRIQGEQTTVDATAGKITLRVLCDRYLATISHQAPKTVAQKTLVCERIKSGWPGGSDVLIRKLVPSQIQTFLSRFKFGPTAYNAHLSVFRAMFDLAIADRLISNSPVSALKERRREKPIRRTPSWDQFGAIVENVREQVFNADAQQSADFLEFLGLAGLGQAEASSLTRADIDFDRAQIITFRHKTRTGFAIPLYPQLRPLLDRLCKELNPEDHVFKIRDAKKSLSNACRRLGFPNFSQRALRRMFITRALELGVGVNVIAEWQGHKDGGKLILDTYSYVNRGYSKQMAQLMSDVEPKNVLKFRKALP